MYKLTRTRPNWIFWVSIPQKLEFVKIISLELKEIQTGENQWATGILKACNTSSSLTEANLKAILIQLTDKINEVSQRIDPHTEI